MRVKHSSSKKKLKLSITTISEQLFNSFVFYANKNPHQMEQWTCNCQSNDQRKKKREKINFLSWFWTSMRAERDDLLEIAADSNFVCLTKWMFIAYQINKRNIWLFYMHTFTLFLSKIFGKMNPFSLCPLTLKDNATESQQVMDKRAAALWYSAANYYAD